MGSVYGGEGLFEGECVRWSEGVCVWGVGSSRACCWS